MKCKLKFDVDSAKKFDEGKFDFTLYKLNAYRDMNTLEVELTGDDDMIQQYLDDFNLEWFVVEREEE